jgi:hypothetical protein
MKLKNVMAREWPICLMEIFTMGSIKMEPGMERYRILGENNGTGWYHFLQGYCKLYTQHSTTTL